MEAEVRNRFRVVRPGESLVIVVDNASGTEAAQNAAIQNKSHTDSELPKPSFFDKMRYFIGL
jgi:hypothetical protein